MKSITKEEFLNVYNKHLPNLFLRIMFKYFSTDFKKSIGTQIIISLMVIFNILAVISDIFHIKMSVGVFLFIANVPFALWGLSALIAFIWNNIRTKRVAKILGLTPDEYNYYADMYVEK